MPDYSRNSYFAVAKQGIKQEASIALDSSAVSAKVIDPNVKSEPFIRTNETGDKVFFVEKQNAHWVRSPEVLMALGGGFEKVVTVGYEVLKTLNLKCPAIDMKNVGDFNVKVEEEKPDPLAEKQEIKPEVVQVNEVKVGVPVVDEKMKEQTYTREAGVISYIFVIEDFSVEALAHLGTEIVAFKKAVENTKYEIVLIANGTRMNPQSFQFSFADKIVVHDNPLEFKEAILNGVRISKGQFPLYVC